MNQAAQIQQISARSDSGDIRHAEKKIFNAGVIRICFFRQSTRPIIGIREPISFYINMHTEFKLSLTFYICTLQYYGISQEILYYLEV